MSQVNSQDNTGKSAQINEHIQQLYTLSKVIETTSEGLAKSTTSQFFQPEQTVKQQSNTYGSISFEMNQDN